MACAILALAAGLHLGKTEPTETQIKVTGEKRVKSLTRITGGVTSVELDTDSN